MIYTIENELLKVSVTTFGAQICSVLRKSDGVEHMHDADPAVWGYHAPILFPYTGKLVDGKLEAKGKTFSGGQHGFARLMEHTFVRQNEKEIVMELSDSPQSLAQWPYKFRLTTTVILEGDCVTQRLTVENLDEEELRFGIGYHPAFKLPFDDAHCAGDYEFRFDEPQSPMCLSTQPHGLLSGSWYGLGKNSAVIPLDETTFSNDSHCMFGLTAKTLGIYEKGTGRGVVCDISGFPYTLIWSKPVWPVPFVCIEPWMSLPAAETDTPDWNLRAAAAVLQPGQSWSCQLPTHFVR